MMRIHLRLLVVIVALLVAAPLAAQEASRFFIERIDVTNVNHVSPEVIVAESRLRTGESYGENELRDANDRIRRLPFVLDATFALQKGSARDRYVLVISVSETKAFFYLFDAVLYNRKSENLLFETTNDAVVGARWFVGRRSAVHIALVARDPQRPYTTSYSVVQAGWTQYDILGTRAFLTIAANRLNGAHTTSNIRPEVVAGIPLSPKQTVTLSFSDVNIDTGSQWSDAERLAELRWAYNTTNHPFFPTRGSVISAGPVATWRDGGRPAIAFNPPARFHNRALAFELEGKRYWELTERTSVAAEGMAGLAELRSEVNERTRASTEHYGRAVARASYLLRRDEEDAQSRAEVMLRRFSRGIEPSIDPRRGVTELSVGWSHRNAWGTVRLGVGYAW